MFETELTTYYKNLNRLREENPLGGFVVIKGETILDVWLNDLDALKEGYKAFGEEHFMIKSLNDKPINISDFGSASTKIRITSHTSKELYSTIASQKDKIPSLIKGGFTNTADDSTTSPYNIELRKYCLDKAIEIFSWKKDFFISKGNTPIEYAEALYKYITTGEIPEFNLPGTRVPNTPTPKPTKLI